MDTLLTAFIAVWNIIYQMITLVIIASVVISFLDAPPNNQIVQIIRAITEPLYRPFRKIASKIPGPLDFAPLILILILVFVDNILKGVVKSIVAGG